MSVKLMQNKTASTAVGYPVYYTKSSTGKSFRVQVSSEARVEVTAGLFVMNNRVGFARFTNEVDCQNFIATALANGGNLPGKVIYVDQLTPISQEATDYGKQYPYPMQFNGQRIDDWKVRAEIQKQAILSGLHLSQSGQPIYRNKQYTELDTAKDCILTPDNLDEVQAFVAKVMASAGSDDSTAKQEEFSKLKAIKKAARTADQQSRFLALVGEGYE